jgi:hypothetical protein
VFLEFCQPADDKLIVILRRRDEIFFTTQSMHDAWKLFAATCILHGAAKAKEFIGERVARECCAELTRATQWQDKAVGSWRQWRN